MKRGEEKRRRRRRRIREEKRKKSRYEIVCMDFFMDFCIDMYRDTCLEVWNTYFFFVESLFGMVVWFGCGLQWRKILYIENVGF